MGISATHLKKLLQLPIFRGLSSAQGEELFDAAVESTRKAGTVLFEEGSDGDSVVVILSGEVLITKRGVELAKLGTNAVLGELSLVGSGEKRSATATAVTNLELLTLPSKRVKKMIEAESLAALKVLANVAEVMGHRMSLINEKFVESLGAKGKKKEELADFSRILNRWEF